MKTIRASILFTIALYIAGFGAFLLADKFGYRRGANDMDQSLITFALVTLVIGVFFLRSLYQAIWVDPSYWLVAVLHVVFTFIVIYYFMT